MNYQTDTLNRRPLKRHGSVKCIRCGRKLMMVKRPKHTHTTGWCHTCGHRMYASGDHIPYPPNTELSSERAAEPRQQTGADSRRLLK